MCTCTYPHTQTGEVIIVLKGREDIIADSKRWMIVTEEGSKRRSGGQGDILAGVTGVLVHWARMLEQQEHVCTNSLTDHHNVFFGLLPLFRSD